MDAGSELSWNSRREEVGLPRDQVSGVRRALSISLVPKVELLSRKDVTNVTCFFTGEKLGKLNTLPICHAAERVVGATESSFQLVFPAGGTRLIARSASAVMVRLGLTPRFAARTDPSQMYMLR